MRRLAVLVALLVLVASTSGCLDRFFTGSVDLPAPDFELTDIDGAQHNLSHYQGRVLLLDFMGTWCGPCQRSAPFLRDILAAEPALAILSVSSTDTGGQLESFRGQYGVTWPLAVDDRGVIRAYADAAGAGTFIWPSYALVKDGRIVFWNKGETLPATFSGAVADATSAPRARLPAEAVPPVLAAAFLGGLAFFTPYLLDHTIRRPPDGRGAAWFAGLAAGGYGLFAYVAGFANRPLTGRTFFLVPFAAVIALAMVWWWRRKGTEAVQADSKGLASPVPARQALALHLNLLYYAFPVWFVVLVVGLRSVVPLQAALMQAAFGAGLASAAFMVWRGPWRTLRQAGHGPGRIGAFGLVLAALWLGKIFVIG